MNARNTTILAGFVLALLVAAALFTGCMGNGDKPAQPPETRESISVAGSTTVLPIAQLTADLFMDTNPKTEIQVSGGGSSVGIQAVGGGTADIGMASRDLKDPEKTKFPDLVSHVVARDGIALIVHPSNTVGPLTIAEVKAIYKGETVNWNKVGGPDETIVVVGRDSASGTREFFHDAVMEKEDFVATQLEKNSNGAVQQTVAQTPGAIGYVGLGYLDRSVKTVPIEVNGTPVEPSVATVTGGEYPIARSLNMFTDGEPTGVAQEYLEFILSPDGQRIVEEEGFVPVQ
ncbi:phosphate ABC transporter substrate-binding protein [Methanofollis aquaemaris]|uniref:Phosphate ABC transporter substrate-binding protein n=1 Tax=Methanofollis aquaemaris TaxID=126734 RepID=A0A8A3S8P8_9EURY|nr:phosphate ABC transporter substrate-binding protein [Methanofollis aquaemaris]QSZ68209.1 phosphate ABC transporter substrate-binding protein [Methanofollis aquaemaris]